MLSAFPVIQDPLAFVVVSHGSITVLGIDDETSATEGSKSKTIRHASVVSVVMRLCLDIRIELNGIVAKLWVVHANQCFEHSEKIRVPLVESAVHTSRVFVQFSNLSKDKRAPVRICSDVSSSHPGWPVHGLQVGFYLTHELCFLC